MGSPTQMVISFTGINTDGEKAHQLFYSYHHWGHGKVMPSNVMQIVHTYVYGSPFWQCQSGDQQNLPFAEQYKYRIDELNIPSCILAGDLPHHSLKERNIATDKELDLQTLVDIFNTYGNDDGYCFMQIVENDKQREIGIAFVRNEYQIKNNPPQINFCSVEKYLQANAADLPDGYIEMFTSFLKIYGIDDISDKLNQTQKIDTDFGFSGE
ncbi:hypothetical protein ACFBZI_11645 [Moraxella sp. ZJ142]|uniref:hypothetical protein n=1 Tax=Moraxella marmotae TaxID=3344520 RepID=UPI0035D43DF5